MNVLDRSKRALTAFITQITSRYDYAAPYVHTVVSQNADGTLELRPVSTSLPGLSHVPIRYGIPGIKATIRAGSKVLVRFEAMDPSRPVATSWDASAVDIVVLDTASSSLAPVARMGDGISAGFPPNMPCVLQVATSGPLGPLGAPLPGFVTIANGVNGYITSASPSVSA